jgi:dolichol-phosphate mannosyltransferase
MISLGIIGTYIAQIYQEVKYRPRYVVAETVSSRSDHQPGRAAENTAAKATHSLASKSPL